MKITKESKKLIADEIDFALRNMIGSENPSEILYFFSAIFGVFHRVFNIDYDSDLVFAHFVLRATHDSFSQILQASTKGATPPFLIREDQMKRLISITSELLDTFKGGESIDNVLKKYVLLMYTTTGNGYYLVQKGVMKI